MARYRTSDVKLKVTRADASTLEVEGRRVRGMSATDVSAHVDQLRGMLAESATDSGESLRGAPAGPHPTE
jgi:hypothetical protein